MDIERQDNPIFEGNIYWLYECLKTEAQEFPFDKPYTDKKADIENQFLIYECLMFNQDREDSLFVMQNNELFEYFSIDKSELLLKLIQYYENRLKYNFTKSLVLDSLPIIKKGPLTDMIKKRFKFDDTKKDPEESFKTRLKANIYLEYNNGKTSWLFDYDLKKILFGLKFLPQTKEIKTLRIFPLCVRELKTKVIEWINKDDQFFDEKELKFQNNNDFSNEGTRLENFVTKLKNLFYDKYLLNLKKMRLHVYEIDNRWYILNVDDFKFEKYENKHIKLSAEGLFYRYTQKYKAQTKLEKDPKKIQAIKSFYDAMMKKYNDLFHLNVSDVYLNEPKRDPTSDEVYKILRPGNKYKYPLSTLMEPKIGIGTFIKYATYNLYKGDNVLPLILKGNDKKDRKERSENKSSNSRNISKSNYRSKFNL